ncbi:porin [Paraburkholderia unamae]|uniref:Porin n=1 Tax=Paraburkholderia unamae TaxID=219649 RepID=A0ABX5K900_9BURK|nr:porin [Paraburkholderia unamae]PVX60056.1 putative porin [Paraburkholderia unamae]CAG9274600.1 Porin [Paraburkholderia unamae]
MKLKTHALALICLAGAHAGAANAQSTVTLYGLISVGIAWSPNQSGHHTWQALSGQNQSPRWGLRGTEDLGGGNSAVFTLENGFNPYNGSASQSGRLFGRQAYVGLSSQRWGTLTAGRQYDAVVDYLGPNTAWSWLGSVGDSDNTFNNIRIQNSLKYVTPNIKGFKATALYGFSNAPGGFSNNRAFSFGASYDFGGLNWNIAYAQYDSPYSSTNQPGAVDNDYSASYLIFTHSAADPKAYASRQKIFGTGGFYTAGSAIFGAMYSNVNYDYLDATHLTLNNFNVSARYYVRPWLLLGAAYVFTRGVYDHPREIPMWHELNLAVVYSLSKRTDLSMLTFMQRAAGDAHHATILGYGSASGNRQLVVTLGIKHKF